MEIKRQDQELRFSAWLIASILLHLIVFLIAFFWYMQNTIQQRFSKKDPYNIPLTIAAEQLQQQEQQKNTPILWKDLKKPEPDKKPDVAEQEKLVYTLIPGRKAVTEPEQQEPAKASEEKIISPPKQNNKQSEQPKQPEEKPTLPTPIKQEQPPQPQPTEQSKQTKTIEPAPPISKAIDQPIPKTKSQRFLDLKEKLLQDPKQYAQNLAEQTIEPFEISSEPAGSSKKSNDPTILKKKVTLQDLKLGFSQFLQEGNNDILMQKGNTNEPPDAQALRQITYKQQLARTMREAIVTHPRYHLVQNIRGTKTTYNLTIERNGKFSSLTMIHGSGNDILDKIIKESLESIKLYPSVPSYIPGDIYPGVWTFLH